MYFLGDFTCDLSSFSVRNNPVILEIVARINIEHFCLFLAFLSRTQYIDMIFITFTN